MRIHIMSVVYLKLEHNLTLCLNSCDVTSAESEVTKRHETNVLLTKEMSTDNCWSLRRLFPSPYTELTT